MVQRILLGALLCASASSLLAQEAVFTTGPATTTNPGLVDCGGGSRVSAVGEITSDDGTVWTVPAATNFDSARKAADLFNECDGDELSSVSQLDLESVPLLDAGGSEEFVAYIFADNYFELYVNGVLLAVDPVPFTPFNSNVVRFTADRPLTIAVMMVDWEENLGLGSENNQGKAFHAGDGGFVAQIQDADANSVAITDGNWHAQTFYTAPLTDRDCLVVEGQLRNSSACDETGVDDGTGFSAAHWAIPTDWMAPAFDDSIWPAASIYSNDTVGVDNKTAFTNFKDIFDAAGADAEFIWSSNLVLDNLVLLRTTVE
ncbi:hypothetical protein [Granulosicoccus antarcticus]|uniref:Uncharacterized protein n=1 Tax=Granulosicoccus antarcticus IMCC3135 TaxID=1192854 RepID=A0A2Z2P1T8_9GAMM|nr:hypothetical protein [Granulosicoccus antarcticus]ASJ73584.1 hypothetical protein IMCC3135_17525 [Granulosicoccus antarcticus IMCC3135]